MITQEVTPEQLGEWKSVWLKYRDRLRPNRRTGAELLKYLQANYVLTELHDERAAEVVRENVLLNAPYAEKLPDGAAPAPRTFYIENAGGGARLYAPENRDPAGLWGGELTRIFVGIDLSSGYYTVEGSTLLWDELCAFQGLDEADIGNYVHAAQYIGCMKRFGL